MKFFYLRGILCVSLFLTTIYVNAQSTYHNDKLEHISHLKDVDYVFDYSRDRYILHSYSVDGHQVIEFYLKEDESFVGAYYNSNILQVNDLNYVQRNKELAKSLEDKPYIRHLAEELRSPMLGMNYLDFVDLFMEPSEIAYGISGDQQTIKFEYQNKILLFRDDILVDIQDAL